MINTELLYFILFLISFNILSMIYSFYMLFSNIKILSYLNYVKQEMDKKNKIEELKILIEKQIPLYISVTPLIKFIMFTILLTFSVNSILLSFTFIPSLPPSDIILFNMLKWISAMSNAYIIIFLIPFVSIKKNGYIICKQYDILLQSYKREIKDNNDNVNKL